MAWWAPSRVMGDAVTAAAPLGPALAEKARSVRPVRRESQTERLMGMNDVTRILFAIEKGKPEAARDLVPLVYEELRKLAAQRLAQEKPGQTFQATALVHEAYLRLVDVESAALEQPGTFFRRGGGGDAANPGRASPPQAKP